MQPINKSKALIKAFGCRGLTKEEFIFLWDELGIKEDINEAVEEHIKQLDEEIRQDTIDYLKRIDEYGQLG